MSAVKKFAVTKSATIAISTSIYLQFNPIRRMDESRKGDIKAPTANIALSTELFGAGFSYILLT